MGAPGLGRRKSAVGLHRQNLPAIEEDNNIEDIEDIEEHPDASPQIPDKSYARRSAAARDLQQYPYPGNPPPSYRVDTPSTSDPSAHDYDIGLQEPLPKDRRPSWVVKRGGWLKLMLFLLLGIICVVALAVGLAVGLRHSSNTSSGDNGGNQGSSPSSPPVFPAGSYTFNTALSSVSTACTAEASTFRCYPYTTFAQSNSTSKAAYFWTIARNQGSPSQFTISAASNPFVPQFDNVPVRLLDANSESERLEFNFTMNAAIIPSPPLQGVSGTATCYYNDTVMSATIFTRRAASYPANLSTPVSNTGTVSTSFDAWPYAVDVRQIVNAGKGVPDCRDSQGNPVGNFAITDGGSEQCSCLYRNHDL